MADEAQPQEGQGSDAGSPFDSYLSSVPDGARDAAEAWFKDTSKGVNEKLEQAAELRKQWEPYSEVQNLPPPEQLSELLQWSNETLTSQETFDKWVTELAEAKGMTQAQAEQEVEEDILAGERQGLTPEQIQQQIDERAAQALAPVQEQLATLQQERGVDVEHQAINGELSRLEKEAGVELDEGQRAQVLNLGMAYAYDGQGNELAPGDASWVPKGFEEFKAIGEQANKAFVEVKAAQPASAITTGGNAQPKPITSFQEAAEAARERFKMLQQG